MPSDSFPEALERLDPASRALLDLSLRRGMRTEDIAELLGADADSVAATRDDALRRVADDVGMGAPEQRDEVRARLAELAPEEWLGGVRAREPAEEETVAEAPAPEPALAAGTERASAARGRGGGRRGSAALVLALAALVAVAIAALVSGGNGSSRRKTAQTTGATAPAQPATAQPSAKPPPQHASLGGPAAEFAAIGGSRATGTARLAGAQQLVVRLHGLPSPGRGSYEVWLYNSVIDARPVGTSRTGSVDLSAALPDGWRRYRSVDVSREPPDGNPSHSGESVARVATATLR